MNIPSYNVRSFMMAHLPSATPGRRLPGPQRCECKFRLVFRKHFLFEAVEDIHGLI